MILHLLSLMSRLSGGLEAYDCEDSVAISRQSLLESQDCTLSQSSTLSETNTTGIILQLVMTKRARARICHRVEASRSVYCNWAKMSEFKMGLDNLLGFKGAPIPVEECMRIFSEKKAYTHQGIVNFNQNEAITYTDTTALTKDGYCSRWLGQVNFKMYVLKYWEGEVIIKAGSDALPEVYIVDEELVKVTDDEFSGTTSAGHTLTWREKDTPRCFLEEVYSGKLTKIKDQTNRTQLLVKERGVGLSLEDMVELCNVELLSTNVPFVYYSDHMNLAFPKFSRSENVEFIAETKSLIQGLFASTALDISQSTAEIRIALCRLEQQVHRDALYGMVVDPDMTAFRQIGVKGWRMIRAGASMVILKCATESVKLSPLDHCTTDIPVFREKTQGMSFMDPVTYVIHTTSLTIPCDDHRVPLLKVKEDWFQVGTTITRVAPPSAFASVLGQNSNAILRSSIGLAPEDLVQKKIKSLSLEGARRRGGMIQLAEQAKSISAVAEGGIVQEQWEEQEEERKSSLWKHVAAFLSPVFLAGVSGTLLWTFRAYLFRKVFKKAVPDGRFMLGLLPREEDV